MVKGFDKFKSVAYLNLMNTKQLAIDCDSMTQRSTAKMCLRWLEQSRPPMLPRFQGKLLNDCALLHRPWILPSFLLLVARKNMRVFSHIRQSNKRE